jgi:hypothetical protein
MTRLRLLAVLALALPAAGRAQPAPAAIQDHREIHQDRRALEEDWRDLDRLQRLVASFDDARVRRDRGAMADVEDRILRAIDRELAQSSRDFAHDRAEARQDRYESDLHGARDHRRDARREAATAAKLQRIRADLGSLHDRFDRRGLDAVRARYRDLVRLAREEVRQDRRELRQDRRELREDAMR